MSDEQKTIVLELRKIFVGDLSVEVPSAPEIFKEDLNPEVSLNIGHEVKELPDDFFEVKLRLTINANDAQSGKTIYIVDVAQSGVFEISGLEKAHLHHALNVYCPTTLYPYAREAVGASIVRAGFPSLFLQPVNFELMYQQKMQELAKEFQAQNETSAQDSGENNV